MQSPCISQRERQFAVILAGNKPKALLGASPPSRMAKMVVGLQSGVHDWCATIKGPNLLQNKPTLLLNGRQPQIRVKKNALVPVWVVVGRIGWTTPHQK